jgi:hypothetical protein
MHTLSIFTSELCSKYEENPISESVFSYKDTDVLYMTGILKKKLK